VTGYGLATLVFGISTSFWLSVIALALVGAFDNVSVVVRQTVDQMLTPPEMRGRVASISFIFVSCSNELGAVESGLTAAWLGPVGSVLLGGIGSLLIVAGAVWAFPELLRLGRLRELQPQRIEEKTSERLEELSV
jgi:MFS family permease